MKQKAAPLPPLWTRDFCLLTLGHFLQSIGWTSMLLLPLLLNHMGATRIELGVVMGVAALGGLCIRPLVGKLIDSWGRRPVLVWGTSCLALGIGPIGWITEVGWAMYLARILIGFGSGALFSAYFVAAADMIPASRRSEGIALFGISGLLPISVSAFVDGIGLTAEALSAVYPWVALIVLSSLVCIATIDEPKAVHAEQSTSSLRALLKPSLIPVWLISLIFASLVATFMTFATVVAQNRGVPWPAQLWMTYSAGAVTVRLFGARLPARVGPYNLVAPALALYAFAFIGAATSVTPSGFLWSGLMAGCGHGYCFPVLTTQVVDRSPTRIRGAALATFTGLWDFAGLIAPPTFGWFAECYNDSAMLVSGALCGVMGLIAWTYLEHHASLRDGQVLKYGSTSSEQVEELKNTN